jgi:hypothetical protein
MKAWLILMVLGLVPALALAGEIRGAVTLGGKSIGQDVAIEVHCGEKAYTTTTDKYGFYRLFIPENGTCQFQLQCMMPVP